MCDDIFGGMFDFNGDGHTDMAEELTGLMIFNELEKEDSKDDLWNLPPILRSKSE